MCKDCGCGHAEEPHVHPHPHDHHHPPSPGATDGGRGNASRTVVLEQRILSRNDEIAARNRAWLAGRGVVALNLISAPGSGKTLLLEKTLELLNGRVKCGVIAGDQQTDNDARRLSGKGAEVRQIETRDSCHLDAHCVAHVLPDVVDSGTKLLFIENVGNLVCPSAFDLGENFKVALLSTAEGEDKPVKYPALFSAAPVTVLTKTDLSPYLDWDAAKCRDLLRRVHPGVFVFELSARTGEGMGAWIDYLERLVV